MDEFMAERRKLEAQYLEKRNEKKVIENQYQEDHDRKEEMDMESFVQTTLNLNIDSDEIPAQRSIKSAIFPPGFMQPMYNSNPLLSLLHEGNRNEFVSMPVTPTDKKIMTEDELIKFLAVKNAEKPVQKDQPSFTPPPPPVKQKLSSAEKEKLLGRGNIPIALLRNMSGTRSFHKIQSTIKKSDSADATNESAKCKKKPTMMLASDLEESLNKHYGI